ncbi:MAG TPA: diguanylate cyclase [Terracidiphilus sp.]|nr:diguanylate cyclase [Terracidiphilus sp.]
MLVGNPIHVLLASPEPALLGSLEPILAARGAHVDIALTVEAALARLSGAPAYGLLLLDANLPGMELSHVLAAANRSAGPRHGPIVLIANTVTAEAAERVADGILADVVPGATEPAFWRIRIDLALRTHSLARQLDQLDESAATHALYDRLTGVYNRDALLATLFRETDRAQRTHSLLCMVLFDIDDFGHWNSRLGAEACDDLLCQVAGRTNHQLRSYDLLGRVGKDEFLVGLPNCNSVTAVMLAERLRLQVFSAPFRVSGEAIRLSACFGISSSSGRSPLVVLRQAEQALEAARKAGPESIQCFDDESQPASGPVAFLSQSGGDELLAW